MSERQVSERPILFSGPMVQRILAGNKTQTRRVLKPQPTLPQHNRLEHHEGCVGAIFSRNGVRDGETVEQFYCPYGGPGDRLWVRETFVIETWTPEFDDEPPIPNDRPWKHEKPDDDGEGERWCFPHYRATEPEPHIVSTDAEDDKTRWFPAIHMPRWTCRLTLEITDVRVQRLQDISPDDLTAEGYPPDNGPMRDGTRLTFAGRKMVFAESWDNLNEHRGYGWESNPFVWCISFDVEKAAKD